jgi:hypothetical protein
MALSAFAEKPLFGENPKYGERFYRMRKYSLLYCAVSFRARHVQLWQIVFSKHGVPGGYETIRRGREEAMNSIRPAIIGSQGDYYKIMENVYRALKQPNAVTKITGLISPIWATG